MNKVGNEMKTRFKRIIDKGFYLSDQRQLSSEYLTTNCLTEIC